MQRIAESLNLVSYRLKSFTCSQTEKEVMKFITSFILKSLN